MENIIKLTDKILNLEMKKISLQIDINLSDVMGSINQEAIDKKNEFTKSQLTFLDDLMQLTELKKAKLNNELKLK